MQRELQVNEAKTKVSKATEGFDFLGWNFRVNSYGTFKSTPSQKSHRNIKDKIRTTWKQNASTEARIKSIASQVRGWRNYHDSCDMSGFDQWKKLRKDKVNQNQKEAKRLLSKKTAGLIANATKSKPSKDITNDGTPSKRKMKGGRQKVFDQSTDTGCLPESGMESKQPRHG